MRPAPTPLNQAAFDRLPLWLPRGVFLEWSGLDRRALAEEVRAGGVLIHRTKSTGRAKYWKGSLAHWAGFDYVNQRPAANTPQP